jgi:hypothetical protein
MRLEVKAFADAPRDLVFRTLTDLVNRSTFVAAVERVELQTPAPIGIGTRYIEGRTLFGRGIAIEFAIVDYDPSALFVLSAESAGIGFEVSCALAYTGHETGIGLEVVGKPETLVGRLAMLGLNLLAGRLETELSTELDEIAREAEKRYAARRAVIR